PAYRGEVVGAYALRTTPINTLRVNNAANQGRVLVAFQFSAFQCERLYSVARDLGDNNVPDVEKEAFLYTIGSPMVLDGFPGPLEITYMEDRNVAGFNPGGGNELGVYLEATFDPISQPSVIIPPLNTTAPYQFSILARPQQTFEAPIELPAKTAIDLSISGIGPRGFQFSPEVLRANAGAANGSDTGFDSISILFSPDGSVESVLSQTFQPAALAGDPGRYVPTTLSAFGNLYLAIGRADGVVDSAAIESFTDFLSNDSSEEENWANSAVSIVSIRPSSGRVFIGPVAAPLENLTDFRNRHGLTVASSTDDVVSARLRDSRRLVMQSRPE
ncbi:MAG: hypothetical protein AAFN70_02065, partial [Planctomycetota bacterium]